MPLSQRLFIALQYVLPHHTLSRLVGRLANCEHPGFKNALIRWFIRRFEVDMAQAERQNPEQYLNFNDFFTRALIEGARPIDDSQQGIACPADGAISQLGSIKHGRIFQAKGHDFSLFELLGGDSERAAPFMDGQFATIYLSPRDYHRVHMPFTGTLKEMVYVPGKLFSVNQTTAENVPELFARNERVVCLFDTAAGPMAVVLVGAMIVASIETVWAGEIAPVRPVLRSQLYGDNAQSVITLNKGDELGRFKLGSTAIVLFGPQACVWHDDLAAGTVVNMGQSIGQTGAGA
ncbi:MAG: phosphatidylserine decarboxylase [Thiopseudomonas sp.]|nr:phosphatidylserine decarboxylase [Thiopseudomonas sp.]